jgi:hypothetical protein
MLHLQAAAMAAVTEYGMLQQAVQVLSADPNLAFASTQPAQCQMLPLLPPMQAAAAAAGGTGLAAAYSVAADHTPAGWESNCSSIATFFAVPRSNAAVNGCGSQSQLMMSSSNMAAACGLAAAPAQQQQQVLQLLLPEATFSTANGISSIAIANTATAHDMLMVSGGWPAGLVTASMAPAVLNCPPMQAAAGIAAFPGPQLLLAPQPAPAWPNPNGWQ